MNCNREWGLAKVKYKVTALPKSNLPAGAQEIDGPFKFYLSGEIPAKISEPNAKGTAILLSTGGVAAIHLNEEESYGYSTDVLAIAGKSETDTKFIYYSLLSRKEEINEVGFRGAGLKHLQKPWLLNLEFPYPLEINTTAKIIDFLDQETAKIDLLIEKQEKLIELLDEKLKATITEAVTKGLNPDVKMKDSGVEWIGEVPEGWSVTKFGRLASFIKGVPVPKEDLSFEGEPELRFLRTGDLWNPNERNKDEVFVDAPNTNGLVFKSKDEMIICFDGFNREVGKGTVGFSTFDGEGFIDGMLSKIATKKPTVVSRRFLEYSAMSSISESFIVTNAQGTTAQHAGHCKGEIPLCLPSLDEQNRICQKLDAERLRITEIKKSSIKLIELLKEKRQALISEAVTGKLDIIDFPIQNADN